MKNSTLSTSTALSTLRSTGESHHHTMILPKALDPVYQCPFLCLDDACNCASAGCNNTFTLRYGVCFKTFWRVDGIAYQYGVCVFCSLRCLLVGVGAMGSDGARREFRDETQTLH